MVRILLIPSLISIVLLSCSTDKVITSESTSKSENSHDMCNEYYYSDLSEPENKQVKGCLAAARAGIPGPQYLVAYDKLITGNDWKITESEALQLLDASSKSGNPLAQFMLGVKEYQEGHKELGHDLIAKSACAGYSEAQEAMRLISGYSKQDCSNYTHNIDGVWIGNISLSYDSWKSGSSLGKKRKIKLVIKDKTVQFYHYSDKREWYSLDNYNFQFQVNDRIFKISGFNSGWDFDGQWNESITLEIAKLTEQDIFVSYRRFVSNEFSLPTSEGRVFSQFGEGRLHRASKID